MSKLRESEHSIGTGEPVSNQKLVKRHVTIRGRVTQNGMEAAGAMIKLRGKSTQLRSLRRAECDPAQPEHLVLQTTSGARGTYRFEEMPVGEYQLEVNAPDCLPFYTAFSCQAAIVVDVPLIARNNGNEMAQMLPAEAEEDDEVIPAGPPLSCGVNIDPSHPGGKPSMAELRELGVTWVRFVFHDNKGFAHYDPIIQEMNQAGIQVLMILNERSCLGAPERTSFANTEAWQNPSQWQHYLQPFGQRCGEIAGHYNGSGHGRVAAFQIWNEPDLEPNPNNPSEFRTTCRPAIYGPLLLNAFSAIRASHPTALVVTAGMASGNLDYVRQLLQHTNNSLPADKLAVHTYGQRLADDWPRADFGFGRLDHSLPLYAALVQRGVWITEVGLQEGSDEIAAAERQILLEPKFVAKYPARFLHTARSAPVFAEQVFWFCWSDGMVEPYGLCTTSGVQKRAYQSFHHFITQTSALAAMGAGEMAVGEMAAAALPSAERKLTVRGRVRLQGAPVADATVRLISSQATLARVRRAKACFAGSPEAQLQTASGKRGSFRFEEMPPGDYRLEVIAAGAQTYQTGFSAQASMTLDIELEPITSALERSAADAPMLPQEALFQCGMNIDPKNDKGLPSPEELKELGVKWVRFVFKNHDAESLNEALSFYDQVVDTFLAHDIHSLMIINNESCPGRPDRHNFTNDAAWQSLDQWQAYLDQYAACSAKLAKHFENRVNDFQIWNEPDHAPREGYDPTLYPPVYAALLQRAYTAIKGQAPNARVITAGMVTGQPGYVSAVIQHAGNQLPADVLAVHTYGQRPRTDWPEPHWGFGVIANLLQGYFNAAQRTLWITEMGIQDARYAAEFPQQFLAAAANAPTPAAKVFWFCWSEGMVEGYGVCSREGERKPAFASLKSFMQAV